MDISHGSAKVSTATLLRVINRIPTVDPQLAKRVWKVADETGYYPNMHARALVSGRSRIFGLVVSEKLPIHFSLKLFRPSGPEQLGDPLNLEVHDPVRMESSVRRMIERRVDGVAILTFGLEGRINRASSIP